MRRMLVLAVVAAMAFGGAPARADITHEETVEYIGSWDPLSAAICRGNTISRPIEEATGRTHGGACFAIEERDRSVTLEVIDDVVGPIGYYIQFVGSDGECYQRDAGGTCVSDAVGCGVSDTLAIPEGAPAVQVVTGGALLGPLTCTRLGKEGLGGFYGKAHAIFSDVAVG